MQSFDDELSLNTPPVKPAVVNSARLSTLNQEWENDAELKLCKHGCGTMIKESEFLEHESTCTWFKFTCPCGVSVQRNLRIDHLEHCKFYKYQWESSVERFVSVAGKKEVGEMVRRVVLETKRRPDLCMAALVHNDGNEAKAIQMMSSSEYRKEMKVASKAVGLRNIITVTSST